jgi:hypothetical protein
VNDEQPDPEQAIAWRAVPEDTPVRSADGEEVGTLADLLGSDVEDIFHGIVIRLGRLGRDVFVPADSITRLTRSHVDVALTSDAIRALPPHDEDRAFDLGITGFFRKRPGWVREKDR